MDVKQADSTHMAINIVEAYAHCANFILKVLFQIRILSYL